MSDRKAGGGEKPLRESRLGTAEVRDLGDVRDVEFEAEVVSALQAAPRVSMPENFAARVAGLAVAEGVPARSPWKGFGMRAALGSGVALTAALFACAPHTSPSFSNLGFDLEMLLLAELGGVAYLVTHLGLGE